MLEEMQLRRRSARLASKTTDLENGKEPITTPLLLSIDLSAHSNDDTHNHKDNLNYILPMELLDRIFSYLKPKDLLTTSHVCWKWYILSQSESLWKSHCSFLWKNKMHRPFHLHPCFDYASLLSVLDEFDCETILLQRGIRVEKEMPSSPVTKRQSQIQADPCLSKLLTTSVFTLPPSDDHVTELRDLVSQSTPENVLRGSCASKWKASYYASIHDSKRVDIMEHELISFDFYYIDRWRIVSGYDEEDTDDEEEDEDYEDNQREEEQDNTSSEGGSDTEELEETEDEYGNGSQSNQNIGSTPNESNSADDGQFQSQPSRETSSSTTTAIPASTATTTTTQQSQPRPLRARPKHPLIRFFPNHIRGPVDPNESRPSPSHWYFDEDDGHLQVGRYPPHLTARSPRWGWEISNGWVVYRSCERE